SAAAGSVCSCTVSLKLYVEAEVSVPTDLQSWNSVVSSSKDPPEDSLCFLAVQLLSSSGVLLTLTDRGRNMLQFT
ncbi:hypothetical protein N302_00583, partial [Corvus brachyrhynchos]